MEAYLSFRTRHLPAMQHHKKILVHSSVRSPALQRTGPPPGAARVAVVGAGVVLACALGTMYWKRARALQLPMSRNASHVDGDGTHPDDLLMSELPFVLSEIFINPKPPRLTKIINKSLNEEGQSLKSVLDNKCPITNHNYNFGLVYTLDLIRQKKFAKAEEICNKLIEVSRPTSADSPVADSRPELFLAIIKMMIAMDSMVPSPDTTSMGDDLKEKLNEVEEAWDNYLKKSGPFQKSPPAVPDDP